MKKNLPTIKQSTEVALSRANTLMDVADKILAKQSTDLVDESWMDVLWKWADDNGIDDEVLPRDREGLVNLTDLDLYNKQLTELPKEIGNLVNLTTLDLSGIQLTKVPKEIGNLINLTELAFFDNQLTELPKEIGNLVSLTTLDLNNNQLTELPKEIGNLVNLTSLELVDNPLTELPIRILNLINLIKLTLPGGVSLSIFHMEWIQYIQSGVAGLFDPNHPIPPGL